MAKFTTIEELLVDHPELEQAREAIAKGFDTNTALWVYAKNEIAVVFGRPPKEYFHRFVDKVTQHEGNAIPLFAELVHKAAVYPKGPALTALFEEYPLLPGVLAEELTSIAKGDGPKAALKLDSKGLKKT